MQDGTKISRNTKNVSDFTSDGKECHRRAILEAERRWCTNSSEIVNNSDIVWGDREQLAVFLDLRLLANVNATLPEGLQMQSFAALKSMYMAEWITLNGHIYDDMEFQSSRETEKPVGFLEACLKQGECDDQHVYGERSRDADTFKSMHAAREFHSSFKRWTELAAKVQEKLVVVQDDAVANAIGGEDLSIEAKLWATIKFDASEYYVLAEKQRKSYGLFPLLARKIVGNLMSESFCERVISVANDVLTKGNTLLDSKDIDMMCTLRVNRTFMLDFVDEGGAERIIAPPPTTIQCYADEY